MSSYALSLSNIKSNSAFARKPDLNSATSDITSCSASALSAHTSRIRHKSASALRRSRPPRRRCHLRHRKTYASLSHAASIDGLSRQCSPCAFTVTWAAREQSTRICSSRASHPARETSPWWMFPADPLSRASSFGIC